MLSKNNILVSYDNIRVLIFYYSFMQKQAGILDIITALCWCIKIVSRAA